MPIKPELRYFYPIDWPQISHWVRFVRAKGHCQVCGRPHGECRAAIRLGLARQSG